MSHLIALNNFEKIWRERHNKKINDAWHIDIGQANVRELQGAGILEENIDLFDLCTSCNSKSLFSYRKDSQESYGEMVGIIGWKN